MMATTQDIAESRSAAVSLAIDVVEVLMERLRTFEGMLPVSTPQDLRGIADEMDNAAIQLRLQTLPLLACANELSGKAQRHRGTMENRQWWQEAGE